MPQFAFGSGSMWGVSLTNVDGSAVTPPVPVRMGILQDVTLDIDAPMKELHGTYEFPVAVGRGKAKISGKARNAQLNANVIGRLFLGIAGQPVTGQTTIVEDEAGTIPGTPYAVTVAGSATFVRDLGVRYTSGANNGKFLTPVTSGPTAGQYSYSAGIYTFAAADTTLTVAISYEKTATGGYTINWSNQLMGNQPTFRAVLKTLFNGNQLTVDLFSCISGKWSMATKLDDFMIPEFDFEAFADSSNNVGLISMLEQ